MKKYNKKNTNYFFFFIKFYLQINNNSSILLILKKKYGLKISKDLPNIKGNDNLSIANYHKTWKIKSKMPSNSTQVTLTQSQVYI